MIGFLIELQNVTHRGQPWFATDECERMNDHEA